MRARGWGGLGRCVDRILIIREPFVNLVRDIADFCGIIREGQKLKERGKISRL